MVGSDKLPRTLPHPASTRRTSERPMIASMTGFARREVAGSWGTLTCELRSVNHRYLEPGFRLPEELRPLESDLRQLLGKNFKRGKIDCTMHLRNSQGAERELRVDAVALERVATAIREVLGALPKA